MCDEYTKLDAAATDCNVENDKAFRNVPGMKLRSLWMFRQNFSTSNDFFFRYIKMHVKQAMSIPQKRQELSSTF